MGLTPEQQQGFDKLRDMTGDDSPSPDQPRGMGGFHTTFDPMLAKPYDGSLERFDEGWIAEYKFDGSRLILQKVDGQVRLYTRRHKERSERFPDLVAAAEQHLPDGTMLDGELAFFDSDGISHFRPLHTKQPTLDGETLTPRYMVFDVMYYDDEKVMHRDMTERKEVLGHAIGDGFDILYPAQWFEGNVSAIYENAISSGKEGLMVKKASSHYVPGKRSSSWRKLKHFEERDVLVVGYTDGEGSRRDTFGSLVLSDGEKYIGKVGTGFDTDDLHRLKQRLDNRLTGERTSYGAMDELFTKVEPFPISVKYQDVSDDLKLRTPVFLRVRDDKPLDDIVPVTDATL